MTILAKCHTELDKLGRTTKGTTPPEYSGKSNADRELDACLHEYFVANIIAKYAAARMNDAKAQLMSLTGTLIPEIGDGESQTVAAKNGNYAATITGRPGGLRIHKELLIKQMVGKYKMSVEGAQAFVDGVSKRDKSSTIITVTGLVGAPIS